MMFYQLFKHYMFRPRSVIFRFWLFTSIYKLLERYVGHFSFNHLYYISFSDLFRSTVRNIVAVSGTQYVVYIIYKDTTLLDTPYVDDILIIRNEKTTQIRNTITDFNSFHDKLKFTTELEKKRKLSFLDTTITNIRNKFEFYITENPSPQTILYTTVHTTQPNTN
jgi:hypothetical protein